MARRWAATVALILALAGCGEGATLQDQFPKPPPVPADVTCKDAGTFDQQASAAAAESEALDYYNDIWEVRGRANFWLALSLVAKLECRGAKSPAADKALELALAEARRARESDPTRDSAVKWGRATYLAEQTVDLLVTALSSNHK